MGVFGILGNFTFFNQKILTVEHLVKKNRVFQIFENMPTTTSPPRRGLKSKQHTEKNIYSIYVDSDTH